MPATPFALRLADLRCAAGLSRQGLATAAGLTYQAVYDLEEGRRTDPAWSTVCKLADALGVKPDAFRDTPTQSKTPR